MRDSQRYANEARADALEFIKGAEPQRGTNWVGIAAGAALGWLIGRDLRRLAGRP